MPIRSTAREQRRWLAAVVPLWALWAGTTAEAQQGDYGARTTVTARVDPERAGDAEARSRVTRAQMEARLPVSAPDALRYEPGLSIQQTAHGQASPYVRGMTGQQVVHVFDGVRLNNGIYRQGPNQYFFSVDTASLQQLEVRRGSASVHYGSDALGGAILATPRAPVLGDGPGQEGLRLHPRGIARYGSADAAMYGRAEAEALWDGDTGLLLGAGYRDVGRLRSGGPLPGSAQLGTNDAAGEVPRFASDGRTQLGTGFREATFDGRLVHKLGRLRVETAVYGYRQFDAPRTDQCPAPEAPVGECLIIRAQHRTLALAALRGDAGRYVRGLDLNVSYQRHYERRHRDRETVQHRYVTGLDTLGAAVRAHTAELPAGPGGRLRLDYGAEAYRDVVRSRAEQELLDLPDLPDLPDLAYVKALRPQYLDRARHLSLGGFTEASLRPTGWLTLRAGGRAAVIGARAAGHPESSSASVSRTWPVLVGRAGIGVSPGGGVHFDVNVDQGLRAPNLDDLTSRQQVASSYQYENAALRPERATTYEAGARYDAGPVRLEGWGYATLLRDTITREPWECPPGDPACQGYRSVLRLTNARGDGRIFGAEGAVTARLQRHSRVRATLGYAWGEAPVPGDTAGRMQPLSRVPPLSGTLEVGHRHVASGLRAGAALRWAAAQDRLAVADRSDDRIPTGGTPGYAVVELRAGYRPSPAFGLSCVLDNLLDVPYRVHGSSVNGAGRSIRLALDAGF